MLAEATTSHGSAGWEAMPARTDSTRSRTGLRWRRPASSARAGSVNEIRKPIEANRAVVTTGSSCQTPYIQPPMRVEAIIAPCPAANLRACQRVAAFGSGPLRTASCR